MQTIKTFLEDAPVGRKLSALSLYIIALAHREPLTARELAQRLGLDVILVAKKCHALKEAGHLFIAGQLVAPPAKRPIAQYSSKENNAASVAHNAQWLTRIKFGESGEAVPVLRLPPPLDKPGVPVP